MRSQRLAAAADVLITMLPGGPELRDMMVEPGGVLAALPVAATWIDMTSTSPAIGRVLAGAARERGIGMPDATVGGGIAAAAAGTLQFAGGDTALLQRHRSLLEALGDPQRSVRGRKRGRVHGQASGETCCGSVRPSPRLRRCPWPAARESTWAS